MFFILILLILLWLCIMIYMDNVNAIKRRNIALVTRNTLYHKRRIPWLSYLLKNVWNLIWI